MLLITFVKHPRANLFVPFAIVGHILTDISLPLRLPWHTQTVHIQFFGENRETFPL